MPNESRSFAQSFKSTALESSHVLSSAGILVELRAARGRIVGGLVQARARDEEAKRLRLTRQDASRAELALAELIAQIRAEIAGVVARLEEDSGERWTIGLRASHFVAEMRTAQAHLTAATVISGRLGFVIDQISEGTSTPNEERDDPPTQAAAA